jgi:hypothetical protein
MRIDVEDFEAWCRGYWRRYREMAEARAEDVRSSQASIGDADGAQIWARVRQRVGELSRQAVSPDAARRHHGHDLR